MKRCPTCNQTFEEEWLSFCTQDGTTLVEESTTANEPPATILSPSQPDVAPPQPAAPIWQPPPPPSYVTPESKSLAVAAMVVGIISVTVGWLCLGPIPGIAAIIMGAVALSQIKKTPDRVGGKPMAVVGVVTGSVTVLIYAGIMVFYVVVLIAANS